MSRLPKGRTAPARYMVAAALLVAAVGFAAPSHRANIRWAPSVTLAQRIAAETELQLRAAQPEGERTWSYLVPDAALIPRIVAHPLVEDTHRIDRIRKRFSPEENPARAWMSRRYERGILRRIATHWPAISGALLLVAAVLGWPAVLGTLRLAPERVVIPAILLVTLATRLVLIMSGGQFFWPDEDRYRHSGVMVERLAAGDPGGAWNRAVQSGHPLFKTLAMLPVVFERHYVTDSRIPATFFALFSVVNVWLLTCVAKRLGAGRVESMLIALLFASSTSFLYFSRHLFPYDAAMTFGLLSLYAAVDRDGGWRASVMSGIWASCCALTYFGYWTFGGAACVVHVVCARSTTDLVRRSLLAAAGLATPFLLATAAASLLGHDFVGPTRAFMGTITQGAFEEGWRVPFEYLWLTERGLLLLWVAAVATCAAAPRRWLGVPRVRTGIVGLVFLYGCLAILSTGLHSFVVYGRLARQLVPFFCLITAVVLVQVRLNRETVARLWLPSIAAAIIIQAAVNARPVFAQQFPPEFITRGEQFAGRMGASRAVTLYASHMYPPMRLEIPPGLAEVTSAPHPLQYVPYQYEGYSPEERQFLRTVDVRMRVLIPADEKR